MDQLFVTQGGGVAVFREDTRQYVWTEVPKDFPEFRIGDPIPEEWSIVPITQN